jgi:hypothetical protein
MPAQCRHSLRTDAAVRRWQDSQEHTARTLLGRARADSSGERPIGRGRSAALGPDPGAPSAHLRYPAYVALLCMVLFARDLAMECRYERHCRLASVDWLGRVRPVLR